MGEILIETTKCTKYNIQNCVYLFSGRGSVMIVATSKTKTEKKEEQNEFDVANTVTLTVALSTDRKVS